MFKITMITNRKLCKRPIPDQIDRVVNMFKIDRIILREKDLSEEEYSYLSKIVLERCEKYDIELIMHKYINSALKLNYKKIHLSLDDANDNKQLLQSFDTIGISIHSIKDLKNAESLGASYVNAGHIFDTDCKKGIPGRNIDFLDSICKKAVIPVHAIGGINKDNISEIKKSGACGACIMSGFMEI